jgi:parvulin-like peptidyl-prolyl isomerase
MKKIYLATLLSLGLNAAVYDGVAIVVKEKPITLYEIEKEMKLSKLGAKETADVLIRQKLEESEMQERNIVVSSTEVYDDIKAMAERNNMSVSDFYDAVREANGLSSTEFKEKIKQKLLSQKLYSAIAYSSLSEPSKAEIADYYALHKAEFSHPVAFDVIIYDSSNKEILQEKVDNPMFYSAQIASNEQNLPFDRISPELASLLEQTPLNGFTPVIPNGKGGFMSFYVKEKKAAKEGDLESAKAQIVNAIMAHKRELALSDYFERLRHNAEINFIRSVE